ncbi:serine hydrolase domain-containing protein [Aminipila sp.]|uniref:serine hydrolase domain-containing protein n=1 Tax=Aminipila sp. TaxID=2060095 RepID=UPI00289BC7E5|nr:serine hydrolase domain-containing protein [Aminipila sp.]
MKNKMINKMVISLLILATLFSVAACSRKDEDYRNSLIDKYNPQGASIVLIEGGQIAEVRNYGRANVEKNIPVTNKTTFKIASISKVVTAYTVMQLVDEGKLDLDAPISSYLTRWKLPSSEFHNDKVTLRTLLSHTSGVSGSDEIYEKSLPDVATALENKQIHLKREPGEEFEYSEFSGFGICQLVIEEVTGEKFEDYVVKNVFQKLGLLDTSFANKSVGDCFMATPYAGLGKAVDPAPLVMTGAGGVTTTSTDLAKFTIALMDYYNNDTEMFQIQKNTQSNIGECCLGIFAQTLSDGRKVYEHNGTLTGWNAQMVFEPHSKNGMVIVTNSDKAYYLTYEMMEKWGQKVLGEPIEISAIASLSKNTDNVAIIMALIDGLALIILLTRVYRKKLKNIGKRYKGTVIVFLLTTIISGSCFFLFYSDIPFDLLFGMKDYCLFTFFPPSLRIILFELVVFFGILIARTRFVRNKKPMTKIAEEKHI